MQKKLLSFLMVANFGVVNANYATRLSKTVSESDLAKPMGELGFVVANVDADALRVEQDKLEKRLEILDRLSDESAISTHRIVNRKALEAALVQEIAGKKDAIKNAHDQSLKSLVDEEKEIMSKESDAALGCFGTEPTDKSKHGRKAKKTRAYKTKKEEISKDDYALVVNNQSKVLSTLESELKKKRYILNLYVTNLQQFGDDARAFSNNGLSLENAKKEDFFDNVALSAYQNTVSAAQKLGITVSVEDMQNVAQANEKTSKLDKDLIETAAQAKKELHKLLNPHSEKEGEDKPSILDGLGDDSIKDQNDDKGALSQ